MDCCDPYIELLSQRLDGPLTQEREQALSDHLAQCPGCRALEGELSAISAVFSDLEEIEAPQGFAQGVMEKIKAQENPLPKVIPFFRRPQMKAVTGLAACAVLCVGLYAAVVANSDQRDDQSYGMVAASDTSADQAEQPPVPEAIMGTPPPAQQRKQEPTTFAVGDGPTVNSALADLAELGGEKMDVILWVQGMPDKVDMLLDDPVQWQSDQSGQSYCVVDWTTLQAVEDSLTDLGDTPMLSVYTDSDSPALCAIVCLSD